MRINAGDSTVSSRGVKSNNSEEITGLRPQSAALQPDVSKLRETARQSFKMVKKGQKIFHYHYFLNKELSLVSCFMQKI